jgi:CheY-like chemotaxis protein
MVATILIVDDDEAVCEIVQEILAPYNVLSAFTGEDGLRILRSTTAIDMLITDVVLPGRYDGFALARQAKALRPRLKVFYASGYFTDLPQSDDIESFYGKFLAKPFRPEEQEPVEVAPSVYRWRRGAAA